MKKPDYSLAAEKASDVLTSLDIYAPPVMLSKILEHYGLGIKFIYFDAKYEHVAGYLNFSKKTIYVNAEDSGVRQAFTIAHELGHWLLHRNYLQDDDYAVLLRNTCSESNKTDYREREANAFAAHLLVPHNMLRKYRDSSNYRASKIFGVSEQVIKFRRKIDG